MEVVEGDWKEFVFRQATEEDKSAISSLLTESFFPEEPITQAVGFSEELENDFERVWTHFLGDELSFVVTDESTDKLVGVCVAFEHPCDLDWSDFDLKTSQTRVILSAMTAMDEQANIYNAHGLNTYVEILFMAVHKDFRRKGLCKEMIHRFKLLAAAREFTLAKATFSNPHSRKAAKQAGFTEVAKLGNKIKNSKGVFLFAKARETLVITQDVYVI